jgi:hypothetical protein
VNVRKSQGYQGDSKVKLVNGGRFVVVSHRAGVEIWDVETKRQLWSRPVFAHTFSVDPRDSGTTITLAMTLSDRYACGVALQRYINSTIFFFFEVHAAGRAN